MKRLIFFSASVALLAACGGGGTSAPAETLPTGATIIKAQTMKFDADVYGPLTAGKITFGYQNEDSIRHTFILAKDGVKVPNFKLVVAETGSVDSGSVELEAGEYEVICDVPGHGNMKSKLTVN